MARLSAKLRSLSGGSIGYWCQGCDSLHAVRVNVPDRPCWTWDGNVEAPTFSPSVLTTYRHPKGFDNDHPAPAGYDGEYVNDICHTFIRGGMVEFLSDCTHALAGKTEPLPDWPYAEGEYGGV